MDDAVVGIAVTDLVEHFRGNIKRDDWRIIDVAARICDLPQWGVIFVSNTAGLELLRGKEIRCISRRDTAFCREVYGAGVEDQLELAV
jgi:hypothetical protein